MELITDLEVCLLLNDGKFKDRCFSVLYRLKDLKCTIVRVGLYVFFFEDIPFTKILILN